MRRLWIRNTALILLTLLAGLGAGLLVGWYVWPVTYTEAVPSRMRQDLKDETVWMAAQAYAYDSDLNAAQARLRPLGTANLGQLVIERAKQAIVQQLPPLQITYLARLAAALGARDPEVDPYLSP